MNKLEKRKRRKKKVRSRVFGTKGKPRLSVYRSNKYIYAQLVDDERGETLVCAGESRLGDKRSESKQAKGLSKTEKAGLVGEALAKKAKAKKIKTVVFDRGAYRYHGRVKALAEGARKGGLKF